MRNLLVMTVFALAWSPGPQAGQLYRCVAAGGAISYQARECAAGSRLTRTIDYVAQPDAAPAAAKTASGTHSSRASPSVRRSSRAAPRGGSRVDACAKARTGRQAELERLGLRRTFDDLSRIDAKVRRACNGY